MSLSSSPQQCRQWSSAMREPRIDPPFSQEPRTGWWSVSRPPSSSSSNKASSITSTWNTGRSSVGHARSTLLRPSMMLPLATMRTPSSPRQIPSTPKCVRTSRIHSRASATRTFVSSRYLVWTCRTSSRTPSRRPPYRIMRSTRPWQRRTISASSSGQPSAMPPTQWTS